MALTVDIRSIIERRGDYYDDNRLRRMLDSRNGRRDYNNIFFLHC